MKTTIEYKVDKVILENAVRDCIFEGISPTRITNIKERIQKMVHSHGIRAIQFPEMWYMNDEAINNYPQSKIDEIVSRLLVRIK